MYIRKPRYVLVPLSRSEAGKRAAAHRKRKLRRLRKPDLPAFSPALAKIRAGIAL